MEIKVEQEKELKKKNEDSLWHLRHCHVLILNIIGVPEGDEKVAEIFLEEILTENFP